MMTQMKAVVFSEYGSPDVLALSDVAVPVPRDGEVLIRIHATTVTTAECLMRQGRPIWGRIIIGLRKPRKGIRTLGTELAGEVKAVGPAVRKFKPGDQVFGFTGFGLGAYAEYTCMKETGSLALKPVNTSFQQAAAAVDGASTALFFLRDKAKVRSGQRVLVIGASGSIGSYAVQIAKHFGAEVTGVCSGQNAELVRSLGADHVIDYTVTDFTASAETYDVIFDTVGRSSFTECKGSLTKHGCYISTTGLQNVVLALWTSITGGKQVRSGISVDKRQALSFLRDRIEAGELQIVIDRQYPLEQIVQAHRYVDTGRKRGNVVVTVGG
jgi:NADPH:quinone reductase-like Zn-dependent oxidoreductase